jgi:fatty-acid desaturase
MLASNAIVGRLGMLMEVASTASAVLTRVPPRLAAPAATQPRRIAWIEATGLAACHFLALFASVPWFFSWTGVTVAVLGLYVFGTVGINLCFHRLLTHRGLVCPKGLEHAFAILGVCSLQDTPARWVAIHRWHHEHADQQPDHGWLSRTVI